MAKKSRIRSPKANKNNKPLIIILICVTAAILIALTVVLVVTGNKDDITPRDTGADTHIRTETSFDSDTVSEDTESPETEELLPEPAFAHGSAFSFVRSKAGEPLQFTNPLTGLSASQDVSDARPVAIMINNIKDAMPQIGISKADILYECLAEGGITRLLMVTCDYEGIGTIGSVRSSREYYIDFAKNHDAVYVHAGGSEEAYSQIYSRNIAHLDGVKADARTGINVSGTVFYRDSERLKTLAYEHTLVTNGQLISQGIERMGYRNTLDNGFSDPIKPIDRGWSVSLSGNDTAYIKIPYRNTHVAEYEYDRNSGKYMRFQFSHNEHIDGATGEQLGFENVIILNLPHRNTGDSYGHLVVNTVGSGDGWYITGGKRIPIKWSKSGQDSPMTLTDAEGYSLIVNRGKTVINIVDSSVWSSMNFN